VIGSFYRNLIKVYNVGDTLAFQDNKGNLSSFLITRIDSTLHNKRGHFINGREYKDISIHSRQIFKNVRTEIQEEEVMILVTKYPDNDSTFFSLRLKSFYGRESNTIFKLNKDTISANNIKFTDYYSFQPYDDENITDKNFIATIYMTDKKGIIAYRNINGKWWTRTDF
jgi:hypothetical protein